MLQKLQETFNYIAQNIPDFSPEFGIILGTGLGQLVEKIEIAHIINYEEIPHFPVSTVEFHKGKLIFGKLGGKKVVCMQGRFHYYEGYTMAQVTYPVRLMKLLGVKRLFVSNAAGGINPSYTESDLMILKDHISLFLPANPLIGENIMGDRFPDMSEPYSQEMIQMAMQIANEQKLSNVHTGVYAGVAGPQLETRSEYRLLGMLGADAVGMSTVPEVIVAVQMGMPVFAISVITDICIPETLQVADINKILAAAYKAEPQMTLLLEKLIAQL